MPTKGSAQDRASGKDLEAVQRRIGHVFADPFLLRTALTHRSFGVPHNERLEFLGDGVLDCVVADLLYVAFDGLQEGELSRLRAVLVRQEALHEIAREFELGGALRLGDGELKSGGAERPSILADALEAIVGAVYLDAGYDVAKSVVGAWYQLRVAMLDPAKSLKDAKTQLQEWLQGKRLALPEYRVIEILGEQHQQTFIVECSLRRPEISGKGEGASRRMAEQVAAQAVLDALKRKEGRT